ncbi:MAG: Hpt domain-containing protein [Fuerstiella sp.]
MRCMKNAKFAVSLLDELNRTGGQRLQRLTAHASCHDFTAVAEEAHSLKGAAAIVCASYIEELAAKIERAARAANSQGTENLISQLTHELQRCLDDLPRLRRELTKRGNT